MKFWLIWVFLISIVFEGARPAGAQPNVLTYHNNNLRTGWNADETVLTLQNVNWKTFGKLFTDPVDGQIYAQPLYVSRVRIHGSFYHVVYVATENNSVYAFNADHAGYPLWHDRFTTRSLVPVSFKDVFGCRQITPIIGITDTPVIDLITHTMYLVSMVKTVSLHPRFFQILHAIDIRTGKEKDGGPITIQASIPGGVQGSRRIRFKARVSNERCGLFMDQIQDQSIVFTAWSSHCDQGDYHGWVIGYNAKDLHQQRYVFNVTPHGTEGSIWNSGAAPAIGAKGHIYLVTANGTFNGFVHQDWGDSFLKLNPESSGVLKVIDFFTPYNQSKLNEEDQDVGAGGVVLLPRSYGDSQHPHLLTGSDKTGEIYLIDCHAMGGYHEALKENEIVQEFHVGTRRYNASFTTPCCFDSWVYWSMVGSPIRAYKLVRAHYAPYPTSWTPERYAYPGCVPSISSHGRVNGILWAIQVGNPAILRAYNASNLGDEIYNSLEAPHGLDSTGAPSDKFVPPTIAQGHVYVPLQKRLVVYGLRSF